MRSVVSTSVPSRSKRIHVTGSSPVQLRCGTEVVKMPAYAFCPTCGSPLGHDGANAAAPQKCFCCGTTHYHNSKPCAGALIVEDGQVLLAERGIEPFRGD